MSILPKGRPEATQADVLSWARVPLIKTPLIVGRRGYFRDMMGVKGRNDINVYDDAIFLVTPSLFVAFNANVDPSRSDANIAQLQVGTWPYRPGTHNLSKPKDKQYGALVQDGEVVVRRFNTDKAAKGVRDNRGLCLGGGLWQGWFGVNIHRGGLEGTHSLACQTLHPSQWDGFIEAVKAEMIKYGRARIDYVLTERETV